MKRIYTKTGDKGMTGIHGGERVPKDDIRIEANGCLDELNAVIGIVRSMLSAEDEWQQLLHAIQRELMVVMSHVATPSDKVNPNELHAAELTLRCEPPDGTAGRPWLFPASGRYTRFGPAALCTYGGTQGRAAFVDIASAEPVG